MKPPTLTRRRPSEESAATDPAHTTDAGRPSKQATPAVAVPSMRAVELRHRMGVLLTWAILLLVPTIAAGTLAAMKAPPAAQRVATVTPGLTPEEQRAGAFAADYVTAWLRATRSDDSELAQFTAADLSGQLGDTTTAARAVLPAVIETGDNGLVSVLVTAQIEELDVSSEEVGESPTVWMRRAFRVSVATEGGLSVVGLPSPAPLTGAAEPLDLAYKTNIPVTHPAFETVTGFLGAYLAGESELDRYVSPDEQINAVQPPAYSKVDVTSVTATEELAELAAPGSKALVSVAAVASSFDGARRPLTYTLALSGRDGRWEINAVQTVPALATPSPDKP